MQKPSEMFDRDFEWSALTAFAADPTPGAQLGVISGRRRQGKTFLLRALCQTTGGFYLTADEAESLHRIGVAIADHTGAPAPYVFSDWRVVAGALLGLGRDAAVPVVIDEFPYLATANPSLPSILQNALAPLRPEREGSRTRLLLCGSAMSFMGRLLSGGAPLRGRAGLELVVHPLDHQLAAEFWGIEDPRLAMKVNAIVGGTPAYRREFVRGDAPSGDDDFDAWVTRTVLSPASPLFREARYLLADELGLHDTGLYHSVLAAIAEGNATRGGIAGYLGRKSGDLAHPLTVLEDSGLITREPDVFRSNRTTFRIAEPLISFYHAVMRPIWADLEYGRNTALIWRHNRHRFTGNVLGSHFENVCRRWARHMAAPDLFGGHPNRVGSGTVAAEYLAMVLEKAGYAREGLMRRSAITPIITLLGLDVAVLLAGNAILTETVFNIPGVGAETFNAIKRSDLPMIQGITLFGAFFIVTLNLVVDIVYAYLDPRVRYE